MFLPFYHNNQCNHGYQRVRHFFIIFNSTPLISSVSICVHLWLINFRPEFLRQFAYGFLYFCSRRAYCSAQ